MTNSAIVAAQQHRKPESTLCRITLFLMSKMSDCSQMAYYMLYFCMQIHLWHNYFV